jgi:DNA-binding response OmpR family regulator
MEVLRYLRKSDWTMSVIMITAFGDKQTHEEARQLGTAAVLDKPFDVDDLVHAARSIVPSEV